MRSWPSITYVHTLLFTSLISHLFLQMDHPAALHRLRVGVPATVEHASEQSEGGAETAKAVAETTQVRGAHVITNHTCPQPPLKSFITFMDALKLRLRAKDQLHPLLQELMTGYARFKGSAEWQGRSRIVGWYVIFPHLLASRCG